MLVQLRGKEILQNNESWLYPTCWCMYWYSLWKQIVDVVCVMCVHKVDWMSCLLYSQCGSSTSTLGGR